MDRFESRMTPRFLAESEKGDVVRAKSNRVREGLMEDKNGKRRASVLSSFSLS